MNEIRSLLGIAARRLEANTFFTKAHLTAIVVSSLVLVLMVADRSASESFVPWRWVVPGLVLIGAAVAAALWSRARPDELHVALLVDERLDLSEKLSTALHVGDRDDAFARAAVEDAVHVARDPKNHERAKRRFGLVAPSGWWASPLLIAVAVLVSMLEPLDLFAPDAVESPDVIEARYEVREALDAVVQDIQQQPQLSNELADMLGDLADPGAETESVKSPEQIRRDAIKRVTDLNDRLDEILNGEKGKSLESMEKSLRKLRTPEDGPGKELAEAMAAGDFQKAQESLKNLVNQIQADELTPEQQEQLVEQLKDMAQQLEELAKQQQDLQEALKQAGMDPQLAQNPEALQQALENNQNLNEQQKQQLQQMAQAQQAANQMCQGLGAAAASLAQAMQDGQAGQAGQAMQDQLSDLEQLQMLMQQAQAAASACQGSCQGLGQGLSMQSLAGMGQAMGTGRGGGRRSVAPTPTRTREVQAQGQTGEGDIIARMLVEGQQVVGESNVTPRQIVADVVEGFEEGVDEDKMPRKYHEAQKRYFGEIERRAKEGAPAPAPATEEE